MGTLHELVRSGESDQTTRFRWKEGKFFFFFIVDTETGQSKLLGDGERMFCDEDGANCLMPGTQQFYDALNMYFENEQQEIERLYLGLEREETA